MSDERENPTPHAAMCTSCGRMHGGGGDRCASCGGGLPRSGNRTRKVTRLTLPPTGRGAIRVAAKTGLEPVRRTRRLRRDPGTETFEKIKVARAEVVSTPEPNPGDRQPPGDAP
ncbi:MAG: hypothetical protein KC635_00860 [Myxococcales bacterium]|nr:hypothetical protein [Myxococcales bacterium]MCB9737028.1 hypothetical protein [Deltaproteobacteria bacterium]